MPPLTTNETISINNDKYLLRLSTNKLVLHHLPSLDIVHKYYSEISFFYINRQQIMTLHKNILTFLKPKCPHLRIVEYQQAYLDWQPIGGLAMSNLVVLYDRTTIAFYYRTPKIQKSWSINVLQEIEQVKNSYDQKFIALKVKQPQNTIFIWDIGNMSKKPNQQIVLKQTIIKWQFFADNVLLIMTDKQLKIYFVHETNNQHFIQYYVPLPKIYQGFVVMNQFNLTSKDSARRSVNTFAFLIPGTADFDIVELYDIEKRQRKFRHSEFTTVKFTQNQNLILSQVFLGCQYEGKILLLCEVDTGTHTKSPRCIVLNENWKLEKITEYKLHQGIGLENIQSEGDFVMWLDKSQGKYKIGRFVGQYAEALYNLLSDHIEMLKEYPEEGIQNAFLTKQRVLFINNEKKLAIEMLQNVKKQQVSKKSTNLKLDFSIDFSKVASPRTLFYLFENESGIYFISGIRYFKFDLDKLQLVSLGFVLKNQRAKLHEVRPSTSSLVYKINEQYILIEYSTPKTASQKVVFRTIKSSDNDKIISLRKDKWAKVNLKEIIYGQGDRQLANFNMQKMYKTLMQENSYYEYDLYWTTHDGMILVVKNYIFFLQVLEGQNGSQIHLIKKGHSYLHRRFSSSVKSLQRPKVINSRNLVIYTGNRIVKLGNQIENYITQNPYDIPDTLLNRQLQMREYFCPHHPSILNAMLENGWFEEIIKLMQKVQQWVNQSQHNLKQLYEIINIEDYHCSMVQQNQLTNQQARNQYGQIIIKPVEVRNQSLDIENLKKLCQHIIANPEQIQLPQNNPLVLENLLNAVVFKLQNSRAFDFFSQTIITKTRILQNKQKPFNTMDVAFLLHSMNKDEALQFLKTPQHKMEWSWVQKYSIVLWYDENIEKWKKWIEEIAMTQFRVQKDPFDCLFWYILAGKKNLLITLFKAQKFNSKQHDAMHTFLQRDFEDPKNKSAALKNAYALIDKKRYIHAMAFFLLADKKQECIRFAMDRLNDVNLASLIHLICYGPNSTQLNQVNKYMIEKGDVWAQHIGWVKQKKHIASYNVLLKCIGSVSWDYTPQLKGFHPSVIQFSKRIKQSIPYKRQLQIKNNLDTTIPSTQNFDHLNFNDDGFDEFQNSSPKIELEIKTESKTETKQPQFYNDFYQILNQLSEEEENGFKRLLEQKSIKFYMRHHFPCLGLTLISQQHNPSLYNQVRRAYDLQKYILTKSLSESVAEIAYGLDDIMSLVRRDIELGRYERLLQKLVGFRKRFESSIRRIKINELNPPAKHQIGEILHYSYFSELIFIEVEPKSSFHPMLGPQLQLLSKTNNLGKIISGISLKVYQQMGKSLQAFKNKIFIQAKQQFWVLCRERYDSLLERKKEKHQKLMDAFELSLDNHIKKQKDDQPMDFNIRMPKSSTMSIILWRKIFHFLSHCDNYMKDKLLELKLRLDKIIHYWVEKQYIRQIEQQISILVTQGSEYRLKLNVITEQFKDKQLDTIEQLLKLIYSARQLVQMEEKKNGIFNEGSNPHISLQQGGKNIKGNTNPQNTDEKSAIEVFKNKSDGLKLFSLNIHDGKGLEIVVVFKKAMRKFQVIDNLVNRDRTKDGLSLIHEDSALITDPFEAIQEKKILSKSHLPDIHSATKAIFSQRKTLDGKSLIKKTQKYTTHLSEYLKPAQNIQNLDFNEIYSIESHSSLPIFFLGGKGTVEVCDFDTVKNYNRIVCQGLQEIIKIQSVGQRLFVLDKEGNLICYLLDYRFTAKPVFELKKLGIIDFSCPNPSQIGFITSNSFQFHDTLLHSKRQCVFKVQMSTPPVAVSFLTQNLMVILRKNQVQIYDVSKGQVMESYNIQVRGRCLLVDPIKNENQSGKILVGRSDCKVKLIDIGQKSQKTIKVGPVQEQKDKIQIESIKKFGNCYFCIRNDGSIYYFSE